jgi:hypothetical protein
MMAVMARESWTDERLDDLSGRVGSVERRMDEGFKEMREEFRTLRGETNAQFAAQHRTMVQMFGGMFATFVVGFLGTIATILTQV